ncbi:MAG: cupin domain-containing protein [Planctomycetes bacterium]|nr:cupin domain-containing protein [Planctomycetota bacterium]
MLTPTRVRFDALAVDQPMPLLERRRLIGEKAMISHITLFKGCVVPLHRHENEQFSILISGALRFTFTEPGQPAGPGMQPMTLRAGEVLHLPGNLPHAAEALEDTIVLDVFSPPSATTGIDRR